jgi:hypothetical protein
MEGSSSFREALNRQEKIVQEGRRGPRRGRVRAFIYWIFLKWGEGCTKHVGFLSFDVCKEVAITITTSYPFKYCCN